MKVLDIALRLVLVAGGVVALVAIWSILTGTDSPLRPAEICVSCRQDLQRGELVSCLKCLGV